MKRKVTLLALSQAILITGTSLPLSSGAVQNLLGWQTINLAVIPFLVLICLANIWLGGKQAAAVSDPSKQMINQ
jgi:hypothetical protein